MSPLNQQIISGFYIFQKIIQLAFFHIGFGTSAADCPVLYNDILCLIGLCLAEITVITFIFINIIAEELCKSLSYRRTGCQEQEEISGR